MSDEHVMPMQIAMLGTDAILAAGPLEPVQIWRACQTIGFDLVIPVTWGEELIASWAGARMAERSNGAAVLVSCPLIDDHVVEQPFHTPVIRTLSPPVACARYVRAALHPRDVAVTYVGGCPGGDSSEINAHITPEQLLARFVEAGVDAAMQPRHFDGQVPPERARYASMPGGTPAAEWLAMQGIRLVEAAPVTVDAVGRAVGEEKVLIDLAASCRCVCARTRMKATRVEPPRTFVPVVMNLDVAVEGNGSGPPKPKPEQSADPSTPPARATFAEHGLSAGEAAPLPEPASLLDLFTTREPW